MALVFPTNPIDGQLFDRYIYNGAKEVWDIVPDDVFPYYVGPTKPTSPKEGMGWFNTENAQTYIYYDDGVGTGQWVATSGALVVPNSNTIAALDDTTITTPADGDVVSYDTATSSWVNRNLNNDFVRLNPKTISETLTIPSGYNGTSAGPLTIADGVTVTIADGSSWSVV